ncbi:MAG: hypothetical protein M0R46_16450 [Candidatus Muirbacterium halophilum]|nr:hypothetical protein [Candidatus Muirbacterium halophilum]
MKYKELKYKNKIITNPKQIEDILHNEKFYWLIDSEFENAKIEISHNTIIWHDGSYLSGKWYYGIFKDGSFHGIWENGIWENGRFDGKWLSGLDLSK